MQPIIKWSGSKRAQADQIISKFPKEIDTYYEPFLGGGSVFGKLIRTPEIKVNKFILSDINEDLINLWKLIKNNPDLVKSTYAKYWLEMNKLENTDVERCAYYNEFRNKFNKCQDKQERALMFNFLLRTCFNGLVRFNPNGEFNTAFHHSRKGILPEKLNRVIDDWHFFMKDKDIVFIADSYENVLNNVTNKDFVYLDPPYDISRGMYFSGEFGKDDLFDFLNKNISRFAMSYDGKSGKDDRTCKDMRLKYTSHEYIYSSISAFKKITHGSVEDVYDSLYVKI